MDRHYVAKRNQGTRGGGSEGGGGSWGSEGGWGTEDSGGGH